MSFSWYCHNFPALLIFNFLSAPLSEFTCSLYEAAMKFNEIIFAIPIANGINCFVKCVKYCTSFRIKDIDDCTYYIVRFVLETIPVGILVRAITCGLLLFQKHWSFRFLWMFIKTKQTIAMVWNELHLNNNRYTVLLVQNTFWPVLPPFCTGQFFLRI